LGILGLFIGNLSMAMLKNFFISPIAAPYSLIFFTCIFIQPGSWLIELCWLNLKSDQFDKKGNQRNLMPNISSAYENEPFVAQYDGAIVVFVSYYASNGLVDCSIRLLIIP
jgi:hypothetical protein